MAKNYSRETKACLVWERYDEDGTKRSGKRPAITLLDGKQKATPHRPEWLNNNHFSIFEAYPDVTSPRKERWSGKRTIDTVREVIDLEAALEQKKVETAAVSLPPWKQVKKPSEKFLKEPHPAVSLKKRCQDLWGWQRREFNIEHDEEMQWQRERIDKSREEHKARRREFRKHIKSSSTKPHNRIPVRKVELPGEKNCHIPKPQPPAPPTIPHPPRFTVRVGHEHCAGAHRPPTPDKPVPPELIAAVAAARPMSSTARGSRKAHFAEQVTDSPRRPMSSRVRAKIEELAEKFLTPSPRRRADQGPHSNDAAGDQASG